MHFARLASIVLVGSLSALVGCSSDSTTAGAADTGDVDTGVSTFRPDASVDSAPADTSAPDASDAATSDGATGDAADASEAAIADASGPKTVDVQVAAAGLSFSPSTVAIKVGDTVRWTWAASGHNVVSGTGGVADGKFCSPSDTGCATTPTSMVGAVYTHKFTTAGSYPYFCMPHASFGMTGTVTVN